MRDTCTPVLVILLLALFICPISAREKNTAERHIMRPWSDDEFADPMLLDTGVRDLYSSAQVDTYCLVWYDFEQINWQGWTQQDQTAQVDTFFHVDDFSGISPGSWGTLTSLEGTKSMWCGARDWAHQIVAPYPCLGHFEYLCSWVAAPGYGNNWNQTLQTEKFYKHNRKTTDVSPWMKKVPKSSGAMIECRHGDQEASPLCVPVHVSHCVDTAIPVQGVSEWSG